MDYLITNANAGSGHDQETWLEHLKSCGITARPVRLADLEAQQLDDQDRLLAVGGDGTMSRAASICSQGGCALGVLPGGTGNDFARGLGIPLEPAEACRTIAEGKVIRVDLGRVGDIIFLNVAHAGIGSEVGRQVGDEYKRWWGRFSYLRGLFQRLEDRRGIKATILCDGARERGRWLEIAVANGRSFGGGHEVFEASPTDGEFDVVAIRPRSPIRLLRVWIGSKLRGKTPAEDEAIVHLRGSRCRIADCGHHPVTADGEPIGETPLRFDIAPAALRVIVPAQEEA